MVTRRLKSQIIHTPHILTNRCKVSSERFLNGSTDGVISVRGKTAISFSQKLPTSIRCYAHRRGLSRESKKLGHQTCHALHFVAPSSYSIAAVVAATIAFCLVAVISTLLFHVLPLSPYWTLTYICPHTINHVAISIIAKTTRRVFFAGFYIICLWLLFFIFICQSLW